MGPGQIIKNRINLDLIEIIQFCLKIYDLLTHPHLWVGERVVGWMGGLICRSMETTLGQHEDNVETTWEQHGDHRDVQTTWGQCGDNMGCGYHRDVETMWGHMETTWGQCGDHRDVETTWGQCGDNMGTTWRPCGDSMETTWGQHGDHMGTT